MNQIEDRISRTDDKVDVSEQSDEEEGRKN
jgi:hypothetical protein